MSTTRNWLTTVTNSKKDLEQRAGLKTSPIRGINYRIDAISQSQSAYMYRKLLKDMHKLIGVPVWVDGAVVTSAITAGDTVLNVDSTSYMEYDTYDEFVIVGGFITDDWDTYEIVGIESFTANTMTLSGNSITQFNWPVGAMIFPIIPCRLEMSHELGVVTDRYTSIGIAARESFETEFEQTEVVSTTTTTTTTVSTTTTTSQTFFTTTTLPPQFLETWGENNFDDHANRTEDTFLTEDAPTSTPDTATVLQVGRWFSDNARGLIRFNPAQDIPAGSTVLWARLSFYIDAVVGTHNVSAYRVLQNWVEDEASWLKWNTLNYWLTSGCGAGNDGADEDENWDRKATALDTLSISVADVRREWDITALVQEWINGTGSEYGIVLISDQEDSGVNRVGLRSSKNANITRRPSLEIAYEWPEGYTTTSTTTTTTTTSTVSTTTSQTFFTTTSSLTTSTTAAPTVETWGENTADDYNTRTEDAQPFEINPNTTTGGSTTMRIGRIGPAAARAVIRFTPNQDIAGATVQSAELFLYLESNSSVHSVSAYRLLLDWIEAQVTWNDYATATAWNTAGADAASDITGEDSTADRRATALDVVAVSGAPGWFSWDVTDLVQDWLDGVASEYGIIIISSLEGSGTSWATFRTSEHATDGNRPYLRITYTP